MSDSDSGLSEFDLDKGPEEDANEMECGCSALYRFVAILYNLLVHSVFNRFAALILTIGDFFGCLVAISLILHFYILIGTTSQFGCFLMWLFGLMSANVLLIPIWAFFQFSYFNDAFIPWECVWRLFISPNSFKCSRRYKYMYSISCCEANWWLRQIWPLAESVFAIVCIVAIGNVVAGKDRDLLDKLMFGVIIILPLLKLSLMCVGYVWNFWLALINCPRCGDTARSVFADRVDKVRDPFVYSLFGILRLWIGPGGGCVSPFCPQKLDDEEEAKTPTPIVIWNLVFEILHLIASLTVFIWFCKLIKDANVSGNEYKSLVGMLVILFIVFLPLFQLQFPWFFLDLLTPFDCCHLLRSEESMRSDHDFASDMLVKKKMYKFRVISMITYFVLILLFAFVTMKMRTGNSDRAYKDMELANTYTYKGQPPEPTVDQKKEIVSQVCYVKPYELKMIQIAALAAASYYNDSDPNTEALLTEFFNDTGITIDYTDQMKIEDYTYGTATAFYFNKQNLTVVSIRGSTEAVDWILDGQLFLSSFLLTASSLFSFFTTTITPYTNVQIKKVIASPLILLRPITMTTKYIADLRAWYDGITKYTNVMFVGHSLGGGLAKLFGHIYGRPAVSVSGPGVSVVQQLYPPVENPDKDESKYETALTSQAEIIPDFDVVPRVEVTAGTRYRVLCNRGSGQCHGIGSTICMIGIMCETEHREFCESAEQWGVNKTVYDSMVALAR